LAADRMPKKKPGKSGLSFKVIVYAWFSWFAIINLA
jgi:hypothetical protein